MVQDLFCRKYLGSNFVDCCSYGFTPDNTYLNNQRLIDHHDDITERGRETRYFGAWCIHISPSLSKIHIMGHPKRSKKFRLRSKIQLMGYSQNFY